jgi:acetylornithine deacetylase/succinyl-diaminopimelate desuccinylase-like protein
VRERRRDGERVTPERNSAAACVKLRTMRAVAALLAPFCLLACSSYRTAGTATVDGGNASLGGGAPDLDPDIAAMLGPISAANLANSIDKLAGFVTRNTCSDDSTGGGAIGDARDWIKAEFAAVPGLTVTLDPFPYQGCPSGAVMRENVLAWKLGSGHPARLVVLGGHYDSRTLDELDGTSPAPGANDSGSQTALVLEAARVMAAETYDATLVFVAFAGEEQGLVGSQSLALGFGQYFPPGASIEAMFNCDIVGGDNTVNDAGTLQQFRLYSPGTPREISPDALGTTDDTSPARGLMRFIATVGSAYVPSMTMVPELREDRPDRRGDHESFLDQSIPAARFIETIESPDAGTLASHQHSPNDLTEYVTPDYTQRIAQIVVASVASLARAPSPPLSIAVTGSAAGPVTLTWSPPASGSAVDHYVVAARATTENFYHGRVRVPQGATQFSVSPSSLGIPAAPAFFVSVAAVDASGHESLFAYPEYRCDATSCVVQADSLDVTATE